MAEEKKKDGTQLLSKKKKVKPRKSRDADCCSVNFLKCVLHIFNVVFMFAGIGVLCVGAWTVSSRHRYVPLLPSPTYPAIAYLLIAAGAAGLPLAALGCCGLKTENRTSLLCYTYFLLITFFLEAGAGALAYYYEVEVEPELKAGLNSTFVSNYALDTVVTAAVDHMQTEVSSIMSATLHNAGVLLRGGAQSWPQLDLGQQLRARHRRHSRRGPHAD
ncbi:CD151 antigen-like isoform X3 [Leguminivora glycinivorella]|uniref:CD151 antigen-like isoform X3 n=1 Tax=Leguminivora glycinivorella TaxID=1035111 RepID=UPI00200C7CFD|nr:CD151 antigen-like isoform X3 [Leguminivora glycinivorella]